MGRRRAHGEQRVAPAWIWPVLIALMLWGTVYFCGAAWALATTSSDDCPTVVDTDSGRDVDYQCSPSGGKSKDTAVLQLALAGLVFGAGTLYASASLAHQLRSGGA